jgi:hypothetical protein
VATCFSLGQSADSAIVYKVRQRPAYWLQIGYMVVGGGGNRTPAKYCGKLGDCATVRRRERRILRTGRKYRSARHDRCRFSRGEPGLTAPV